MQNVSSRNVQPNRSKFNLSELVILTVLRSVLAKDTPSGFMQDDPQRKMKRKPFFIKMIRNNGPAAC